VAGLCGARRLCRLWRVAAAGAAVLGPAPAAVALTPERPAGITTTVNAGPGNQIDPHISGSLVTYTSEVGETTDTEIRYHDLATGTDAAVPAGPESVDFLSDVSGSTIVFTRAGVRNRIYRYEVGGAGAPIEVAPEASAPGRLSPRIGGGTVAFMEESRSGGGFAQSDIVAHDLATGSTARLTDDALGDREPAVSPDGSVVVFSKCDAAFSSCEVYRALRSGDTWTTSALSTGAAETTADTNGALIAYTSLRAGERDVFTSPWRAGPSNASRSPARS
jgi:hypothetical protein